jgi:hypothetical protein
MTKTLIKHFVTFYSPGTFVSETSTKEIPDWDIYKAMEMAHEIVERYGATPYGFRFHTSVRGPDDFNPKETKRGNMYFLGGRIKTLAEVEARNDPNDRILISNMKSNDFKSVVVNDNSYRSTMPLNEGDMIVEWTPRKKKEQA